MTDFKPETIDFRRTPTEVEITLLAPPLLKHGRKHFITALVISCVIFLVGVLPPIALTLFGEGPSVTVVFPFVALLAVLGLLGLEFNFDRQPGVVSITNQTLTILTGPSAPSRQWPVRNVANVSAWVYDNVWELRVDLKEGKPFRAFQGRSRAELQFCAGLLRAALAPPRPSPAEKAVIAVGGECQVCGAAMQERVVFCAKCKTPHHEECWYYNGSCSTYGCREIRTTRTP